MVILQKIKPLWQSNTFVKQGLTTYVFLNLMHYSQVAQQQMPRVEKNIHKLAKQKTIRTTVTKAEIHWLVIAGHPHTANTGWNTTFRLGYWCMNTGIATQLV